ncbi:MAG: type II/IV secretion system ATPase subunit [Candidatus Bathyarchaeum tardum]|nr:MAG: type II/IV secretion system ATPase subunit [Candidatus Bathyarchaeum tardum]
MKTDSKFTPRRKASVFREVYPINEPYVYAAIVTESNNQKLKYELIEPTLLKEEEELLKEIKTILIEEIDINLKEIETRKKAEDYLKSKIPEIIKDYRIKIVEGSIDKLAYYIIRDFLGYGKIDALMKDPLIEDISADGVGIPLYVWHRDYESLSTNVSFKDSLELNSFIVRLAYLSKKNISLATPILDASLPDGSRIQMTYGNEITRRGSTFTIRRFRLDPLTITDLIALGTISAEMGAYFWFAIENRASFLVAGGVASGKTTILNCFSMFIKPGLKLVSVEDTAELNLPHENWIPSVARTGFGHANEAAGDVTLFDLLKAAVRQRPDYLIVGEVRGQEAYTLFQAMATGHLGMGTIHGESATSVIHRLESEPMNIPRPLLTMIHAIPVQLRTEVKGKPVRRTRSVTEIIGLDPKTKELLTHEVYRWDARFDRFVYSGHSYLLDEKMKQKGLNEKELQDELFHRKTVLDWMVNQGIRNYTDVVSVIQDYYADPIRVFRRARMEKS